MAMEDETPINPTMTKKAVDLLKAALGLTGPDISKLNDLDRLTDAEAIAEYDRIKFWPFDPPIKTAENG